MPPMDMGELDPDEVKRLANAFQVVTRRLVWMIGVIGVAVVLLLLFSVPQEAIRTLPPEFLINQKILCQSYIAIMAFFVALALCRAYMLVLGDYDLVRLQCETLVQSARRRHVRNVDSTLDKAERERPFEPPSNYGNLIEH